MVPMFRQIAKCVNSSHFQVCGLVGAFKLRRMRHLLKSGHIGKCIPLPPHCRWLVLFVASGVCHTVGHVLCDWIHLNLGISPISMVPYDGVQVGERALFLWNNDYIVSLVAQNRHVILPVVFGALERNARTHWNAAVHGELPLHRCPNHVSLRWVMCYSLCYEDGSDVVYTWVHDISSAPLYR